MGNETNRNDGKLVKPPVRPTDPAGGTEQRNPSTTTARTPAGGGSTAGSSPAGGTEKRTEEKEVPSKLATIKTAPDNSEGAAPAPNAPQKQQRRKKTTTKKKTPESGFNAEQISALLVSVSTIAATRPDLQMFALTEIEAMQIATPLANMIAKSEQLSKVGEYSDAISLVTACLVVMVPRLLMYSEMQKQKKLAANGGVKLVKQEGKSVGSSERTPKPDTAPAKDDGNNAFAAIPSFI